MTKTYIRLTALLFLLGCSNAHAPAQVRVDVVSAAAKAIVDSMKRAK